MRISINCCLVVITSFAIARLVSSHMFSMAFMSGEFPGQGKTEKFFSQKCSNTSGFVAQCRVMHKNVFVIIREHSLPCGSNRVSSTRLYWSCFIVPSTMLPHAFSWDDRSHHDTNQVFNPLYKAISVKLFARTSSYKRTFVNQNLKGWFVGKTPVN